MVNIMIVEDEKPISNLIALSLKKVGYIIVNVHMMDFLRSI